MEIVLNWLVQPQNIITLLTVGGSIIKIVQQWQKNQDVAKVLESAIDEATNLVPVAMSGDKKKELVIKKINTNLQSSANRLGEQVVKDLIEIAYHSRILGK